jgi:hypothetical protein
MFHDQRSIYVGDNPAANIPYSKTILKLLLMMCIRIGDNRESLLSDDHARTIPRTKAAPAIEASP